MTIEAMTNYINKESYFRNGGNGYVKQRAVNIKLHRNKHILYNEKKAYEVLFDNNLSQYFWDDAKFLFEDYNTQLQEIFPELCFTQDGRSGGHLVLCNKEYPYRDIKIFDNMEEMSAKEISNLYKTVRIMNNLKKALFFLLNDYCKKEIKEEVYIITKKHKVFVEKEE
jgi:hypothetical protein